jgi:hypothetical protein
MGDTGAGNETLLLLVKAWRNSLYREIDLLREQLPKNMPREKVQERVENSSLFPSLGGGSDVYREAEGEYVALGGLLYLAQELDEAVQTLSGESEAEVEEAEV